MKRWVWTWTPRFSSWALNAAAARLLLVAGDDDGGHRHSPLLQVVDELHGIGVIGDAEIRPHLLLLDVAGVDAQNDFRSVPELLEEAHLHVGIEPREDPGRVKVEEELPSEFQVELVAEAGHSFPDGGRLFREVFLVVEADGVGHGVGGGWMGPMRRTGCRIRCRPGPGHGLPTNQPHPGRDLRSGIGKACPYTLFPNVFHPASV